MDEAKIHEIRQWLFKVQHDLRSARRLFSDEPPILDTAAYHCQQAAEALTPFATTFRYPGDVLEPERGDVEEGMELAELVFDLVLSRMPDEVRKDEETDGENNSVFFHMTCNSWHDARPPFFPTRSNDTERRHDKEPSPPGGCNLLDAESSRSPRVSPIGVAAGH